MRSQALVSHPVSLAIILHLLPAVFPALLPIMALSHPPHPLQGFIQGILSLYYLLAVG